MTGDFSWCKAGRVRREHSEAVTRTGEREIARHTESRGQLCLEMIRHVQSVSYLSLQRQVGTCGAKSKLSLP